MIYEGTRAGDGDDRCRVTVDGKRLPLRLDLRRHSPTGFEWGYGGSGPAQLALALALCAHHARARTGPDGWRTADDIALAYYQAFKQRVVVSLPIAGWRLTSDEIERVLSSFETMDARPTGRARARD